MVTASQHPRARMNTLHDPSRAGIPAVLISDSAISSATFIEDAYRRAVAATLGELTDKEPSA